MNNVPHHAETPVNFDHALASLQTCLSASGWPGKIVWLNKTQFIKLPAATIGSKGDERLILYRPPIAMQDGLVRSEFDHSRAKDWIVRLEALGKLGDQLTYACLNSSAESEQGEMGIANGVKVLVAAYSPKIIITRSRLIWLAMRYYLRNWEERRDRAFCR
ncbi:hypothetical protein ACO0LM_19990 [Undibacterium sp. Di26W]|uniref:hypothetical protein n=1 Tax=Undibacterium sp. Di26W TaxID=3413035 RepID=UPI003BF36A36